ncbi:tyrosine-protein phosphatase [Bacteroidota bacterium]
MKANLVLIGLLFLSILGCQNNSKTTEDPSAATDVTTVKEVILSEPGISLGIASVPNLRDLGGYKTKNGATVVHGLVYRSNQLAPISPEDMKKFAELGLKNDYDLRTEAERTPLPDQLPPGVNNVWLDVLKDATGSAPTNLLALLQNPEEGNKELGDGKIEAVFIASYRDFVSLSSQKPPTTSSLLHWPTKISYRHCFTAQRVRTARDGQQRLCSHCSMYPRKRS